MAAQSIWIMCRAVHTSLDSIESRDSGDNVIHAIGSDVRTARFNVVLLVPLLRRVVLLDSASALLCERLKASLGVVRLESGSFCQGQGQLEAY